MKFIASLIACLTANEVLGGVSAKGGHWDWFTEKKYAYCHYTEDYYNWSKPRMLFDLYQRGADDNV